MADKNLNNIDGKKGSSSSSPFIYPVKVKHVILNGNEIGEPSNLYSADKWGGPDAVGMVFFEKLPTMILTALVIALILSIIAIALSWLPWFSWMIFLIPFFVVIYLFSAIMIPFVAISKGMPYGEKCDDEDLCFHKNTKIIMENMSIKKIEDIKIGDYLFMGGKVLGIVKTDFKGLKIPYGNIKIL